LKRRITARPAGAALSIEEIMGRCTSSAAKLPSLVNRNKSTQIREQKTAAL
jgi:hypothetical protein